MIFVDNKGVQISYKVEGKGTPLVLIHGGFGYKEMWKEMGVVESLKKQYKLISIDLRGHGVSDKPHDPSEYSMSTFVSDIVAVLDKLEISKSNYWGYSMGGWIGFGMVRYAPERLTSLICGGAQAHDGWTTAWKSGWLSLFKKGDQAVLASIEKSLENPRNTEIEEILNRWFVRIQKIDLKAIQALMSYSEKLNLDDYLSNLEIPYLFYGGDTDKGSWIGFEDRFKELNNCSLVTIPGGHILAALSYKPLKTTIEKFLKTE